MEDWSLHSNSTGGFFQCNRHLKADQSAESLGNDNFGSAQIDAIRSKVVQHEIARFIQYYTRYQAYCDSVALEKRMVHETLMRIQRSLEQTLPGTDSGLKWLQGDRVVHPFISYDG